MTILRSMREGDRRSTASMWRADVPTLAVVFVALALFVLAVTPVLMTRRLEALHRNEDETTGRAHRLVDSLNALTVDEMVVLQRISGGDPVRAGSYREVRASQDRVIASLREVAPRISAVAMNRVDDIASFSAKWHSRPDSLIGQPIVGRRALEEMSRIVSDRDAMLLAEERLAEEIELVTRVQRAQRLRVLMLQRSLSLALGGLAVLATMVVAWFARRERRLAGDLNRSIQVAEHRRAELESATESRNRLMRGFSHDVKNPINAADGYLQLLHDEIMGPVVDKQRVAIKRARRSLKTALHLIDDLLALARAEKGHVDLELVPTDARAVAREAGEQYRAQAEAKGLAMTVDASRVVPTIISDPRRVRQVLGNLISNAVKYTASGTVTVRVGHADPPDTRVAISVIDTGPGIPPEQQSLLFQEFVRLDPTAGPGVGIGLAMSARIAEALGGTITMRSERGRGSEFVLWLPSTRPRPLAS